MIIAGPTPKELSDREALRPSLMQMLALSQIQHAGSALKMYLPALRKSDPLPPEYATGLRNHLVQLVEEIDATFAQLDGSEVSRG